MPSHFPRPNRSQLSLHTISYPLSSPLHPTSTFDHLYDVLSSRDLLHVSPHTLAGFFPSSYFGLRCLCFLVGIQRTSFGPCTLDETFITRLLIVLLWPYRRRKQPRLDPHLINISAGFPERVIIMSDEQERQRNQYPPPDDPNRGGYYGQGPPSNQGPPRDGQAREPLPEDPNRPAYYTQGSPASGPPRDDRHAYPPDPARQNPYPYDPRTAQQYGPPPQQWNGQYPPQYAVSARLSHRILFGAC